MDACTVDMFLYMYPSPNLIAVSVYVSFSKPHRSHRGIVTCPFKKGTLVLLQ